MNVFKQLIVSFSSPKKMALFRFQGIGKTILYLFFLMFIATIPIAISFSIDLHKWSSEAKQMLASDIPDFTFQAGEISSANDKPIIKTTPNHVIVFDSTGTFQAQDLDQYPQVLAILKREIIFKNGSGSQSLSYDKFGQVSLTKQDIESFLSSFAKMSPFVIILFSLMMYLFTTALKFIGVAALALIGLSLKNVMKWTLSYKQLFVLSAYAVSIPTIFFAIIDALKVPIPFPFAIYWGSAMLILYVTVNEIPSKRNKKHKRPV